MSSNNRVVRRVARRTYDQYSTVDYSTFTDNLNPVNPTQLESQFNPIIKQVQARVINAYNKAKIEVPEELFRPDVSPVNMLTAVDSLIRRINRNPLTDITEQLDGNLGAVKGLLQGDLNFMDNPYKLDCDGIKLPLGTQAKNANDSDRFGDEDSEGAGSGDGESDWDDEDDYDSDSDKTGEDIFKIHYNGLLNDADIAEAEMPTEYQSKDCPLTIPHPRTLVVNGIVYKFEGWYTDQFYNYLLINDVLEDQQQDVELYALFDVVDLSAEGEPGNLIDANPNLDSGEKEEDCGEIELAFLKIILIILLIVKILITVLVTVYNIIKATTEIVKQAQLCWINPPFLADLIAYVVQRLAGVIFMIIGMLLTKLWAMLNLDCISENALNSLEQVNQILAGLSDIMGDIDSVAIDFQSGKENLAKNLSETLDNLKKQMAEAASNLKKEVKELVPNMKQQLKDVGQDIADTYTNPATYLNAVPPEIRNKVLGMVDAFNNTKEQLTQTYQSFQKTKAILSGEKPQECAKGTNAEVIGS